MTLSAQTTSDKHAAAPALDVIPTGAALAAEVRGGDGKVNGEAIGSLGDGEAVWHTDMSYLDMPPKASLLYALEVPHAGGNTSFCTMYGIYEALPAKLKERIASLKIKHDGTYNSGGYVR